MVNAIIVEPQDNVVVAIEPIKKGETVTYMCAGEQKTITALEDGRAEILDSGNRLTIDFHLWYETTRRRGGFVSALGERL